MVRKEILRNQYSFFVLKVLQVRFFHNILINCFIHPYEMKYTHGVLPSLNENRNEKTFCTILYLKNRFLWNISSYSGELNFEGIE